LSGVSGEKPTATPVRAGSVKSEIEISRNRVENIAFFSLFSKIDFFGFLLICFIQASLNRYFGFDLLFCQSGFELCLLSEAVRGQSGCFRSSRLLIVY